MGREVSLLDQIRIASPCHASWSQMKGDERVRFCESCRLNVYNLTAMSRAEAEELIRSREGRLCVRMYQRADGTLLAQDCPVGLRAVGRAAWRVGAAVVSCLLTVATFGMIARSGGGRSELRSLEPFQTIAQRLSTPAVPAVMLGTPQVVGQLVVSPRSGALPDENAGASTTRPCEELE